MMAEGAQECAKNIDTVGYNYLERLYKEHHEKYPDWKIYGSETSSTIQSRGIYHFPLSLVLVTFNDGQCSCLGNCWTSWGAKNTQTVISNDRDCPFSQGQFIWTGWDYIGEPTPYHSKSSYFGQIDTAGFPKDTYYLYKSEWRFPYFSVSGMRIIFVGSPKDFLTSSAAIFPSSSYATAFISPL